jgi:hypothetical protein
MVRVDVPDSLERAMTQQRVVTLPKLDPDITDHIFVEMSLEKDTIGDFILSGLNVARLPQL